MASISADLLSAVYAAFNARFRDGMQRGRVVVGADASMAKYLVKYSEIAMGIPSTTGEEVHTWISQIPGFVEWVGDRIAQQLGVSGLRVTNKDYQQTVEIDRNKILDDQYGVYGNIFANMGAEGADDAFWLDLAIAALISSTEVWADNAAFFGTTRKLGDNTIVNQVAGAITQARIKTAVGYMLGYKGSNNLPLNVVPYMILCGTTAFWTAKALLENELITDGSGNQVTNETRGIAVPRWHYGLPADAWYVMGSKGSFMPLAAQRRQEASNLVSNVNPTDPNVFWQKKFVYGTDLRGNAFRPFPFTIVEGYSGSGAPAAAPAGAPEGKKK